MYIINFCGAVMEDIRPNEIQGLVDDVTFRNEENGFTVLELEWNNELITVVGVLPDVFPGETLTVKGIWQSHPIYGEQMKAETFERDMPVTAGAILRYLSTGAIKGIGPATAAKIVDLFGEDSLYVIETDPQRLTQIKGISKRKAFEISEEYKTHAGINDIIALLSKYAVTANEALGVWKKWGTASRDIIEENPYMLCSPDLGIGFDRIDEACSQLDRPYDDAGRIFAGILHVLRHNMGNGHTCLPERKLVPACMGLLGVPEDIVREQLELAIDTSDLIADTISDDRFIFLPEMYRAETYCAGRLSLMSQFPPPPITGYEAQVELNEKLSGFRYEKIQKQAICQAMENGILVLTGGPGTGKTTTLKAIIEVLEMCGNVVAIAAPTGRAAKRITEVTGREAKTIHRLLEVKWGAGDIPTFERNSDNPLECDTLIVDELSMTDVLLFESLLRALRLGCRLILVGDRDQLPSVGAGNVLADLIGSEKIPVIHLKEVFRQAQSSAIVTNAHKIVKGVVPELGRKDSDFFFLECFDYVTAASTVEDLCFRRLPAAYDYNPLTDIQVLCPGKKGVTGTKELNKRLQARLNPQHTSRNEFKFGGVIFREGDKVMQIKNNYDVQWTRDDNSEGQGMFNGDIGIIKRIDRDAGCIYARFEDKTAIYPVNELDQLEHAYAVTVHKSQGSEFEAVIIPVMPVAKQLCYRSLLYTAVTRAKTLLILVGSREVVADMVYGIKKTGRYTALCEYIKNG